MEPLSLGIVCFQDQTTFVTVEVLPADVLGFFVAGPTVSVIPVIILTCFYVHFFLFHFFLVHLGIR